MASPGEAPPTYSATIRRDHREERRQEKDKARIQVTATFHIFFGVISVIFGIVNVCIWAWWSYLALPIWAGIVIYMVTGFAGLWTAAGDSRASAVFYTVMSALAVLTSIALPVLYGFAANNEAQSGVGGVASVCHPYLEDTYIINCPSSRAARISMDALVGVVGFAELIVSCISMVAACRFGGSSKSPNRSPGASGITNDAMAFPSTIPGAGPPSAVFILQQPDQPFSAPYPGPEAQSPTTQVYPHSASRYDYPPAPQPSTVALPAAPDAAAAAGPEPNYASISAT